MHTIKPKKGSRKKSVRVGRGLAKKGTYSGKGVKGQKSRAGSSGLQKLGIRKIMLSIPKKRGFTSQKDKPETVNVGVLNKTFQDGAKINPKALQSHGLIEGSPVGVKILGDGDLGIKLNVLGCKVSKTAKEKIEKAGGSVK